MSIANSQGELRHALRIRVIPFSPKGITGGYPLLLKSVLLVKHNKESVTYKISTSALANSSPLHAGSENVFYALNSFGIIGMTRHLG